VITKPIIRNESNDEGERSNYLLHFNLYWTVLYLKINRLKSNAFDPKDDELYLGSTKAFERGQEVDRISNAQIDFLTWV